MLSKKSTLLAAFLASVVPVIASAATVTFNAADATKSAQAVFETSSSGGKNYLSVTLSNQQAGGRVGGGESLTSLFFSLPSSVLLSAKSADLAAGARLVTNSNTTRAENSLELEKEWQYKESFGSTEKSTFKSNFGYDAPGQRGISATGIDLFGSGDGFGAARNAGFGSPAYGILGSGMYPNGSGQSPQARSAIVFKWEVTGGTVNLANLTDIGFFYGTGASDDTLIRPTGGPIFNTLPPVVPLPPAALAGLVLMGATVARRRLA